MDQMHKLAVQVMQMLIVAIAESTLSRMPPTAPSPSAQDASAHEEPDPCLVVPVLDVFEVVLQLSLAVITVRCEVFHGLCETARVEVGLVITENQAQSSQTRAGLHHIGTESNMAQVRGGPQ